MQPELSTDTEIVEAICSGGERAAEAIVVLLVDVCGPSLSYYSRKIGIDEDELGHMVLLHLAEGNWRRLRMWQGTASLKTWIKTIAWNLCVSQKRNAVKYLEHLKRLNDWRRQLADESAIPQEMEFDREVTRSEVLRAIEQLENESQRLLVQLHEIEGRSIQETADLMGIPVAGARVIKHRARIKLRELLEGGEGGMANVPA